MYYFYNQENKSTSVLIKGNNSLILIFLVTKDI